jgi:hypothetical protein
MKFPEFDFQLELPQKYSLNMPCLKYESPIATNMSTDRQQQQFTPEIFLPTKEKYVRRRLLPGVFTRSMPMGANNT